VRCADGTALSPELSQRPLPAYAQEEEESNVRVGTTTRSTHPQAADPTRRRGHPPSLGWTTSSRLAVMTRQSPAGGRRASPVTVASIRRREAGLRSKRSSKRPISTTSIADASPRACTSRIHANRRKASTSAFDRADHGERRSACHHGFVLPATRRHLISDRALQPRRASASVSPRPGMRAFRQMRASRSRGTASHPMIGRAALFRTRSSYRPRSRGQHSGPSPCGAARSVGSGDRSGTLTGAGTCEVGRTYLTRVGDNGQQWRALTARLRGTVFPDGRLPSSGAGNPARALSR
jgi:hypothetical protein